MTELNLPETDVALRIGNFVTDGRRITSSNSQFAAKRGGTGHCNLIIIGTRRAHAVHFDIQNTVGKIVAVVESQRTG
jgi:hypothetical protein